MSHNLLTIIDYVNDNFRFGSKIKLCQIEKLFDCYPITNTEKEQVYEELKSLEIKILYSKESFKEKISNLFLLCGSKKELRETVLIDWFKDENITFEMQKQIRQSLNSSGYTIINDVYKEINYNDFDFLNDLHRDDLDEVLKSESFTIEVSKMKDVVDKQHNLEYLRDFQNAFEVKEIGKQELALDSLVRANKNLVWKNACRFKRFSTVSFNVDDMYQAGMQGMMKAIEKFDINKGYQFSTYATCWIEQSIRRSIANFSTTIRIPVHTREKIIKYNKTEREFWNDHGRIATGEELAEILDTTPKKIQDLEVYRGLANITSLDIPVGTDESSFLREFVPDEKTPSPEEYATQKALKKEIQYIFEEKLSAKEANILNLRFGLIDGETHTLEDIGEIQGVTRERIRQIESKAIRKLKNPKILERLGDFYYDRECD